MKIKSCIISAILASTILTAGSIASAKTEGFTGNGGSEYRGFSYEAASISEASENAPVINTVRIEAVTPNEIEVYGYLPDDGSVKVGHDIAGTYREGPVKLLSYLGLMGLKDVENELFDAETIITRAEATEVVTDAFGGGASHSGALPFADVDLGHENYEDIKNAYGLGYITGYQDSSFRPNDYVTKAEFTFMMLRAIGYREVISDWFDNNVTLVMQHAKRLDLFDNVPMEDYNEPISRGDAAMVIYNALLAPQLSLSAVREDDIVYEENDNLLKTAHNMEL